MDYDKPLLVMLLGVISTIPYEIFTRMLLSLGIGKYSVYQLSSLIVTLDRPTAIMGALITSIVAGVIAMVFYHSTKIIGSDYIVVKGLVTGLLSWVITEFVFTWQIEGPKVIQHRPVGDYYLEASGATIFGIILGLLFRWFIIPNLEKKNQV